MNNVYVRVAWTQPGHNFEAIDKYDVRLAQSDGTTYTAETTNCNGADSTIFSQKYCDIPLAFLSDSSKVYKLTAGTTIKAKVAAHNKNGWGPFSDANTTGAVLETIPNKMLAPTRHSVRATTTTISKIVVDWQALVSPANGYVNVVSYNLQWDKGTGGTSWSNLVGYNTDSLVLQLAVADNIQKGSFYQFKVRAKNFWGWGAFSDIVSIKAAKFPAKMVAVTSSIDPVTGGMKIMWLAPYNNEQPITKYKIELKKGTAVSGPVWLETASCNGADSTTITNMYCIVPMPELRSTATAGYNYVFREMVVAKVQAYNSYGWGDDWSDSNTSGGTTRVEPG